MWKLWERAEHQIRQNWLDACCGHTASFRQDEDILMRAGGELVASARPAKARVFYAFFSATCVFEATWPLVKHHPTKQANFTEGQSREYLQPQAVCAVCPCRRAKVNIGPQCNPTTAIAISHNIHPINSLTTLDHEVIGGIV